MIQSKFKSIVLLMVASVFFATNAVARTIDLQVNLGTPVMEAGKNQKTFLKIGLRGFELPGEFDRAPVNMAIVLDRSGSMAGEKLAIGQLELTSLETAFSKKDEMLVEMGQLQADKGYHSTIVLLTDINKLDTTALIISKDADKVAKALNSTVADHAFELPGVVSRKKQIIPFLQAAFEG